MVSRARGNGGVEREGSEMSLLGSSRNQLRGRDVSLAPPLQVISEKKTGVPKWQKVLLAVAVIALIAIAPHLVAAAIAAKAIGVAAAWVVGSGGVVFAVDAIAMGVIHYKDPKRRLNAHIKAMKVWKQKQRGLRSYSVPNYRQALQDYRLLQPDDPDGKLLLAIFGTSKNVVDALLTNQETFDIELLSRLIANFPEGDDDWNLDDLIGMMKHDLLHTNSQSAHALQKARAFVTLIARHKNFRARIPSNFRFDGDMEGFIHVCRRIPADELGPLSLEASSGQKAVGHDFGPQSNALLQIGRAICDATQAEDWGVSGRFYNIVDIGKSK